MVLCMADNHLIAIVLVQHRPQAGIMHSQCFVHHPCIPAQDMQSNITFSTVAEFTGLRASLLFVYPLMRSMVESLGIEV